MREEIKILKGLKKILEDEFSNGCFDKSIKYGIEKTFVVAVKQFPIWNGFWTQKVLDLVKDYSKKNIEERKKIVIHLKEIIERAIDYYTDENFWDKSIQYIKGVGPQRAKLLNKLGINTVYDLITYYPRE